MKTYSVECYWTMYEIVTVKAGNEEEAKNKVIAGPLPNDSHYLDDSFEIVEMVEI